MRNGDQNFNNEHGFEFVSYIYGELDLAERAAFEEHLAVCDECAVELASYSDARLGVIEWRREDFDHLETPAIVVPWVSEVHAIATAEAEPTGVFTRFIERLSSFPLFAKAGMGLAAAAVAIGVFYFASYSPVGKPDEMATNNKSNDQTLPASEMKTGNAVLPSYIAGSSDRKSRSEIKTTVDRPEHFRRSVVAVRANTRPTIRRNELATTNTLTSNKSATRKAPRLTSVDDDDDKSLRLADLFAEIGTSEE